MTFIGSQVFSSLIGLNHIWESRSESGQKRKLNLQSVLASLASWCTLQHRFVRLYLSRTEAEKLALVIISAWTIYKTLWSTNILKDLDLKSIVDCWDLANNTKITSPKIPLCSKLMIEVLLLPIIRSKWSRVGKQSTFLFWTWEENLPWTWGCRARRTPRGSCPGDSDHCWHCQPTLESHTRTKLKITLIIAIKWFVN